MQTHYCYYNALVYLLFIFCSYSIFPPKIALTSTPWKQVPSTWNFSTMCRVVPISGRLLFGSLSHLCWVFCHQTLLTVAADTLQQQAHDVVGHSETFTAVWTVVCVSAGISTPPTHTELQFIRNS